MTFSSKTFTNFGRQSYLMFLKGQCQEIFFTICCSKDLTWAQYENTKTVLRTFSFSWRYLQKRSQSLCWHGVNVVNDYADTRNLGGFTNQTAKFKHSRTRPFLKKNVCVVDSADKWFSNLAIFVKTKQFVKPFLSVSLGLRSKIMVENLVTLYL